MLERALRSVVVQRLLAWPLARLLLRRGPAKTKQFALADDFVLPPRRLPFSVDDEKWRKRETQRRFATVRRAFIDVASEEKAATGKLREQEMKRWLRVGPAAADKRG
ncbi:hypothetical protein MRX96_026304 [Rhipicephalus microplus]